MQLRPHGPSRPPSRPPGLPASATRRRDFSSRARARRKTEQELDRCGLRTRSLQLHSGVTAAAPPPGHEGVRGRRDVEWLRRTRGHRWKGRSTSPSASRSSGPARGSRPSRQPAPVPYRRRRPLRDRFCADATGGDHTKNLCPGERDPIARVSSANLLDVYGQAIAHCRPGASLAELDRLVRDGIAEAGYPGQPSHPVCHASVRERTAALRHQAGGGTIEERMVLAISRASTGSAAAGFASRTTSLSPLTAPRSSRPFLTGWYPVYLDGELKRPVQARARSGSTTDASLTGSRRVSASCSIPTRARDRASARRARD